MKKVLFIFLLITSYSLFAQSVSNSLAGKKTAERCLKLSENYLFQGDTESALSQCELGLSYDDSISDLFYVKAVCKKNMGAPVREVLELSAEADRKDKWAGHNEKGNRVLYADLLSDTGRLEEALQVLDRSPFVFSADAEAIRIKTYYRLGTDEYVDKARGKINSARRIYKGDIRFINLFYNFELAEILRNGKDYLPSGKVLEMADVLRSELKNYPAVPLETESLSMFFMEGEEQIRAMKAFSAEEKTDYLYPVTALKAGMIPELQAVDDFFVFAEKNCTYDLLKYFASMLTEKEALERFFEYITSYSGVIFDDLNRDLQWEYEITYERGRPQKITYDAESDGITDFTADLDFGELKSAKIIPLGIELFYSPYAYIERVVKTDSGKSIVFDFAKKAVKFTPLSFEKPELLQPENPENAFYVPSVRSDWNAEDKLDYLQAASFIKLSSYERSSAVVSYSLLDGQVVSALFADDGKVYASCDFADGLPSVRYVDYDFDGNYETAEFFSEYETEISDEEKAFVETLFPYFDFGQKVYLSSIAIDRNNDNEPEFIEYYSEDSGKKSVWILDGGRKESFVKYPVKDGEPVIEETVFEDFSDYGTVSVRFVDGKPSSVSFYESVCQVIQGRDPSFFWVGSEGDELMEYRILNRLVNEEQGKMVLVEHKDERFRCIKIGKNYFARPDENNDVKNPETENAETEVE